MNNTAASQTGGLSVAIPGELKGYWELHQKYGKLPWATLVQPTIKLCKEGHVVTPYLARIFNMGSGKIKQEPSLRYVFVYTIETMRMTNDFQGNLYRPKNE